MALMGGILIGISASMMLYFVGRIAGISGIFGGLLTKNREEIPWRVFFLSGFVLGALLLLATIPQTIQAPDGIKAQALILPGILVGFGTQIANGCTSGHGVCGLSLLSKRSLAATLTFMGTGFITATIFHLINGAG